MVSMVLLQPFQLLVPFGKPFKIITLGIQSGAEISITFLDAVTKIANAYIEIIGNVSKPVADVIQSALRIFDLVRNARENVIKSADAASEYVDSIQPTALKRKANQATQRVAQNVNKQIDEKARQVTQQAIRPRRPVPPPRPNTTPSQNGGKKKIKIH